MAGEILLNAEAASVQGCDLDARARAGFGDRLHPILSFRQGNAFDIASLQIALLRASDIPARYVHGTIEVEAGAFRSWAGGFEDIGNATGFAAVLYVIYVSGEFPLIHGVSVSKESDPIHFYFWFFLAASSVIVT